MSKDSFRAERIEKLKLLKKAGICAYPARTKRTHTIALLKENFDKLSQNDVHVTIVGRVMSIREHGSILFVDIFDGTDRMQIVFQKDNLDEGVLELFLLTVDRGDFIETEGRTFVTKRGENSVKGIRWNMLAKSIMPIPDEWFGLKDEEERYRRRYLDILLDKDMREMFIRKSLFWNAIRQFFLEREFIEVETPILETIAGGADAMPFISHHNALDMDVYLRISAGELWQKRLLIAGYPKVFEIGRIFRNEGISTEHLQDYTQLEYYEAYSDFRAGMKTVKDLYCHIADEVYDHRVFQIRGHTVDFDSEWQIIDYVKVLKNKFGINVLDVSITEMQEVYRKNTKTKENVSSFSKARLADKLFKSVRKEMSGPAFLVGVPTYVEPLAKRSEADDRVVERFQVIIAGSEVGKGYSELNDPIDQKSRLEDQQVMRDKGDTEAQMFEREYIEAMEYGMPPAFGFGVSERLFSFLEDRNVRATQIFPLLRKVPSS